MSQASPQVINNLLSRISRKCDQSPGDREPIHLTTDEWTAKRKRLAYRAFKLVAKLASTHKGEAIAAARVAVEELEAHFSTDVLLLPDDGQDNPACHRISEFGG